jgi:hypothetical protein
MFVVIIKCLIPDPGLHDHFRGLLNSTNDGGPRRRVPIRVTGTGFRVDEWRSSSGFSFSLLLDLHYSVDIIIVFTFYAREEDIVFEIDVMQEEHAKSFHTRAEPNVSESRVEISKFVDRSDDDMSHEIHDEACYDPIIGWADL